MPANLDAPFATNRRAARRLLETATDDETRLLAESQHALYAFLEGTWDEAKARPAFEKANAALRKLPLGRDAPASWSGALASLRDVVTLGARHVRGYITMLEEQGAPDAELAEWRDTLKQAEAKLARLHACGAFPQEDAA